MPCCRLAVYFSLQAKYMRSHPDVYISAIRRHTGLDIVTHRHIEAMARGVEGELRDLQSGCKTGECAMRIRGWMQNDGSPTP